MVVNLVIKNGKVVLPSETIEAGVAIENGKIVAVATDANLPRADKTIDAKGNYILPGVIDPHVHLGYPYIPMQRIQHNLLKSQWKTETEAAAHGGITTIGHYITPFANQEIVFEDNFEANKSYLESESLIDSFFHIIIEGKTLSWVEKGSEAGIQSFKFSLPYAAPGEAPLGDGGLFEGFEKVGKIKPRAVGMVHAENGEIIKKLAQRIKDKRQDAMAWPDSRPKFCEIEHMLRTFAVAEATNAPIYVVHMTIGEGVGLVKDAKLKGMDVTAETCPQYLTHTKDNPWIQNPKNRLASVVNPPLRDKWDIATLWKGIADGWVDSIGSDHALATWEQKGQDIWNTVPGLGNIMEVLLPVILSEGVNKGRISLNRAVEICCYNPAKSFGLLPKKGTISIGADADITIVDLERKLKPKPRENLYSDTDWNIYEDWELKGWPVYTLVRGEVVMEDGEIVGKKGYGEYVPRPVK